MTRCTCLPWIVAASLFTATTPLHAESGRFYRGVVPEAGSARVDSAAALFRSDRQWLTLGSHVDAESRETPHLILREAGGAERAAVAIAPDSGLSWSPRSLVEVGDEGDVIVFGIEYDHRDLSAPSGLFLARIDAQLGLVWSRHVTAPAKTTLEDEDAALRMPAAGESPMIVGQIRHYVDGVPNRGDALLSVVDPATGDLLAPRAIGTADGNERGADVVRLSDNRLVLLSEVRRSSVPFDESGDGLITLDADGAIAASRLIGHPASGLMAMPLRLFDAGDGWVIAGRLAWVDQDSFYLHRLDDTFEPAAQRSLIPFFVDAAVEATAEGIWLYGQANDDNGERGTTLLRFDSDLSIGLQRRYPTDNPWSPTGAIAAGDGGLLLTVGAYRGGDGDRLAYESFNRVRMSDGAGLVCKEGESDGFSIATNEPMAPAGWLPTSKALSLASTPTAVTARSLALSEVVLCATQDDLLFRDSFDR